MAEREIDADVVARVIERVAENELADPSRDDLTVPLAIELADAQTEILRLKGVLTDAQGSPVSDAAVDIIDDMVAAWLDEDPHAICDDAPRVFEGAFRADCERLAAALRAPEAADAGAVAVTDPRIFFLCKDCEDHNPDGAVSHREDIGVMPDGTWLCDSCYSDCDKTAYGMTASDVDDFEFPRFEDLPRPTVVASPAADAGIAAPPAASADAVREALMCVERWIEDRLFIPTNYPPDVAFTPGPRMQEMFAKVKSGVAALSTPPVAGAEAGTVACPSCGRPGSGICDTCVKDGLDLPSTNGNTTTDGSVS